MTTETALLTADDLLRLHSEGVRGEFVRGVLRKRLPGGVATGVLIVNLASEIGGFARQRRLGVATIGSGYLLERQPDTVREAPIAFTSYDKIPRGQRITGYANVAPDLVVEVTGFNRNVQEIFDKARMWLSYGAQLIWVAYADSRSVDIHRAGHSTESIGKDGELDGLDALPGFRCSVASIFGL